MTKLKQKLEMAFFDLHIRGCTVGDEESNQICARHKTMIIDELIKNKVIK